MKRGKKEKNVLFTYLSEDNYKYVKTQARQIGQSATYFVEALVEAHRKKVDPVLETRVPAYVEKAKKWKEQRTAKSVQKC